MGLGNSRVVPEDNAFINSRSVYASVPSPAPRGIEIDNIGMNEQDMQPMPLVESTEPSGPQHHNSTVTDQDNSALSQSIIQSQKATSNCELQPIHRYCPPTPNYQVIPITFNDSIWTRCHGKGQIVTDATAQNDQQLDSTSLTIDTSNGQLNLPRFRTWQIFPGRNRFYCNGRCMTSKDTWVFYPTFVTLHAVFALFFVYVLPDLVLEVSILLGILGGILYFASVATMLYASCSDPGIIPRGTISEIRYCETVHPPGTVVTRGQTVSPFIREVVNEKQIVRRWCTTCKLYKPPRSTHCRTCNNCVDRFDHHCPFLGNCVGQRNYPTFVAFIVVIIIVGMYIPFCCSFYIYRKFMASKEDVVIVNIVIAAFVGLFSFLVFLTMIPLVCLHYRLTATETTTNEDFKRRSNDNPYDRGSKCKNCFYVMCSAKNPSLIRRRDFVTKRYLNSLNYFSSVESALKTRFGRDADGGITDGSIQDGTSHNDLQSSSLFSNNYNDKSAYFGHSHYQANQSTDGAVSAFSTEYISNNYPTLESVQINRNDDHLLERCQSGWEKNMEPDLFLPDFKIAISNSHLSDGRNIPTKEVTFKPFGLTRTNPDIMHPAAYSRTRYDGSLHWNSIGVGDCHSNPIQ